MPSAISLLSWWGVSCRPQRSGSAGQGGAQGAYPHDAIPGYRGVPTAPVLAHSRARAARQRARAARAHIPPREYSAYSPAHPALKIATPGRPEAGLMGECTAGP